MPKKQKPQSEPSRPRFIALKESARRNGIPYSSWRRVIREEGVMVYKFGGRWYLTHADHEAFLERHRERFE